MPYVTQAQMVDRYGEAMIVALTDREAFASGTIDTATVNRALADTDAVIDGYLARRYALPLSAAQPILVDLAAKIAVWNLHTHQPDPKIEADYKAAMATLRDIASGAVALSAAGIEATGTGGTGVRITDRERPFDEDNMKGFI